MLKICTLVFLLFVLNGCNLSVSVLEAFSKKGPVVLDPSLPAHTDNQGTYPIGGHCLDSIESFEITAPMKMTVPCVDGKWDAVLDLTPYPDGEIKIEVSGGDKVGVIIVSKDTTPPNLSGVLVNGGSAVTNQDEVWFDFSSSDAASVYLSEDSTCASGGAWQNAKPQPSLTLSDTSDGLKSIYVKARDSLGNETSCSTFTVTLDKTPPVVSGLADSTLPQKTVDWSWSCTDLNPPCRYRYLISKNSSDVPTGNYSSKNSATQDSGDGIYYIHVQAMDLAGNESSVSSASAVLDNSPPTITFSSADRLATGLNGPVSWTITYADISSVTVNSSVVTFSGALVGCTSVESLVDLVKTVTVSGCSGAGSLGVKITSGIASDSLGNSKEISQSFNITVDNTPPTLSLSAPSKDYIKGSEETYWLATYAGATTVDLKVSDISFTNTSAAVGCNLEISEEATFVRRITMKSCTGDGATSIRIVAGTAHDEAGNESPLATNATNVNIVNTPRILMSYMIQTGAHEGMIGTPKFFWAASEISEPPQSFEVRIAKRYGDSILAWTNIGLATSYSNETLVLPSGSSFEQLDSDLFTFEVRAIGANGKVSYPISLDWNSVPNGILNYEYPLGSISSVVTDFPGGRIIAGDFSAVATKTQKQLGLAVLKENGGFDNTFSKNKFRGEITRTLVLSNGKIIVLGRFSHVNDSPSPNMVLLGPDGGVDSSFTSHAGIPSNESINNIIEMANGKLFLHGNFNTFGATLFKNCVVLNADGSVDATLSQKVNKCTSTIQQSLRLSSGKIFLTHSSSLFPGDENKYASLLNADLSIDSAFSAKLKFDNYVSKAVEDADGNIVLVGNFTKIGNVDTSYIVRLKPDGEIDSSLNVGTGPSSGLYDVQTLASGQMILRGYGYNYNGQSVSSLFSINKNGSLRPSFSGPSLRSSSYSLIKHSEEKILIVGQNPFEIKLIDNEGKVDNSFNYAESFLEDVGAYYVSKLGSNFLISGRFNHSFTAVSVGRIARLNPDGSLDTSFASTGGENSPIAQMALEPTGDFVYSSGNYIRRMTSAGLKDSSFNEVWFGGASPYVKAILPSSPTSYYTLIGGKFSSWDWENFMKIDPNGNTVGAAIATNGSISAMTSYDGGTLVVGEFTKFGGVNVSGIAKLDRSGNIDTYHSIHSNINFLPSGFKIQAVYSVPSSRSFIIIGTFQESGSVKVRLYRISEHGGQESYKDISYNGSLEYLSSTMDPSGAVVVIVKDSSFYSNVAAMRFEVSPWSITIDRMFKISYLKYSNSAYIQATGTNKFLLFRSGESFYYKGDASLYWEERDSLQSKLSIIEYLQP